MNLYLNENLKDKIFFTSDLHLNHDGILKLCNRPFQNVNEMNSILIENWNNIVPKDGIVFNLGDYSWSDPSWTEEVTLQLNGKQYFVLGNHDKIACNHKVRKHFLSGRNQEGIDLKIHDYIKLTIGQQCIIMHHYPEGTWEKIYHNTWMLHGHTHNNYKVDNIKLLDVGVDNPICNFTPLSYFQIEEYMNKIKKPV